MSIAIHHRPLGIADLSSPAVQAFDCGTEVWEVEINQWLRAEPDVLGGAHEELSLSGNPAWQHFDAMDSLVGISSIGSATASYPKNSSPRLPAACFTWLAVDKNQQQMGYGQVILDFLVAESPRRYPEARLIVALVHVQNPALGWYCNARNHSYASVRRRRSTTGRTKESFVKCEVVGPLGNWLNRRPKTSLRQFKTVLKP